MVEKTMSIGQVLSIDRGTAPIFMSHGMHCLGCPHATSESIEQAAAAHGVDAGKLVDDLNAYLNEQK